MIIVNTFGVLCCPKGFMYISRSFDSLVRKPRCKPMCRLRHDAEMYSTSVEAGKQETAIDSTSFHV